MRLNRIGLLALASFLMLAGCGDDSSSVLSPGENAGDENYCSSSVSPKKTSSSSSAKVKSSSSERRSSSSLYSSTISSSSSSLLPVLLSSSSLESVAESSSSSSVLSSSSVVVSSSSEEVVEESSSSKECWKFLNPEKEYGELIDERDGQVYKTIKINDRVWMAENLKYDDVRYETHCVGDSANVLDHADSCVMYGRLYTWAAAIDSVTLANDPDNPKTCGYGVTCGIDGVRGICPTGWHLPTYAEWYLLIYYVGGEDPNTASKMLRAKDAWEKDNGNEDVYGFSAVPAGLWHPGREIVQFPKFESALWSSTDADNNLAYSVEIRYDDDRAYKLDNVKRLGMAVRCVQDK